MSGWTRGHPRTFPALRRQTEPHFPVPQSRARRRESPKFPSASVAAAQTCDFLPTMGQDTQHRSARALIRGSTARGPPTFPSASAAARRTLESLSSSAFVRGSMRTQVAQFSKRIDDGPTVLPITLPQCLDQGLHRTRVTHIPKRLGGGATDRMLCVPQRPDQWFDGTRTAQLS